MGKLYGKKKLMQNFFWNTLKNNMQIYQNKS